MDGYVARCVKSWVVPRRSGGSLPRLPAISRGALVVGCVALLIAAMCAPATGATPSGADTGKELSVEVRNVAFDHTSNSPVVLLECEARGKALPIWVGHFEAQAIAMELQGLSGPRPLTHDLMKSIVETLKAEVDRVVIDDLREHTYYATIHLRTSDDRVRIDSRPSDAIALALRFDRPILVTEALLTQEGAIDLEPQEKRADVARVWGLTLQDVTANLADIFELGQAEGVLVSDVASDAVAVDVQRGDVITDVHGETVHSVTDLRTRASSMQGGGPVELGLKRRGVYMQVHFRERAPEAP
jgi:bifunctional DNase/RNase